MKRFSNSRVLLDEVEPDTEVVGIDEGQFFDQDLPAVCNALADRGKRVIVAGLDLHRAVRGDVRVAVAVVEVRLEDLDFPFGDLRAPQPPDQLLALAAEHAAGNHFDPAAAGTVRRVIHCLMLAGPHPRSRSGGDFAPPSGRRRC